MMTFEASTPGNGEVARGHRSSPPRHCRRGWRRIDCAQEAGVCARLYLFAVHAAVQRAARRYVSGFAISESMYEDGKGGCARPMSGNPIQESKLWAHVEVDPCKGLRQQLERLKNGD